MTPDEQQAFDAMEQALKESNAFACFAHNETDNEILKKRIRATVREAEAALALADKVKAK